MDNYEKNHRNYSKRKKQVEKGRVRHDCEKLKFHVKKSIERVAVGAIEDIEKTYGHLWAMGENRELTEQELDEQNEWLDLRDSIFDRAHDAIRIMNNKIDDFESEKNG